MIRPLRIQRQAASPKGLLGDIHQTTAALQDAAAAAVAAMAAAGVAAPFAVTTHRGGRERVQLRNTPAVVKDSAASAAAIEYSPAK